MARDARVIAVLTEDTIETILGRGGSGDWVLDPKRANAHRYLVCCRKPKWSNRKEGIPDHAAFLVGGIKAISGPEGGEGRGEKRFFIEIGNYALVANPVASPRDWRNPVAYCSFEDLGVDRKSLKFKPMKAAEEATPSGSQQLTILEAKRALAKTFGVSPDDIDITIRA